MLTDPIADMLTRVRNANIAMHDDVSMPASKLKVSLAKLLEKEGYITGYSVAPASAMAASCSFTDDSSPHTIASPGPAFQ